MIFTLGFSPCPNDTFIFDALIHHKIDTDGLEFKVTIADVEELNRKALEHTLDITKLSFHAFLYVKKNYTILNSGSALGDNCGPLLISKLAYNETEIPLLKVAIPGKYTTANYLLSIAYPNLINKQEMHFSEIENAVLSGNVDAGVIIHENRFTYESKGLIKLLDLGEYWHNQTKMPIPLGGIAISKKFSLVIQQKINYLIKESIEFAFANPKSSIDFIKSQSQEMSDDVIQKHINLYVNNYSLDLGIKGKMAIELMFEKEIKANLIKAI